LTILAHLIASSVFIAIFVVITGDDFLSELPQSLGSLSGTGLLLFITWRLGWFSSIGVSGAGRWWAWLLGLGLLLYVVTGFQLAFYGEISLDWGIVVGTDEARSIFWRQWVVGIIEEILFRGVILYALARVWGANRRGLIKSAVVSAFLFGALHLLQGVARQPIDLVILVSLEAFLSGIWYAVYVLLTGTLWPIVVIHAISNMVVNLGHLVIPGWRYTAGGLFGASLVELPLVLLAVWLIWRKEPSPRVVKPV
jgi:membrane protease YdiL (CAAX protease family)